MQEFAIKEAKNANVRVRIAHSHNALTDVNIGKRLIYAVWRKDLLKNATNLAACSLKAGKWMFGDECGCYIVKNRIDVDKYKFDAEKRELRRREINVSDDEILIGTIGTVNEQKNHAFLLPIIDELIRVGLPVKLCIVGRGGEYKDNLFNRVEEMNLGNSVVYCGVSNVVEEWLSAMDLFVMPSIYEGFGIAALEAQASGLSCLLSSAFPVEVAVSSDVKFLPLNVDAWISAIKEWAVNRRRSTNGIEKVEQAGYGIESMLDDVKYLYF